METINKAFKELKKSWSYSAYFITSDGMTTPLVSYNKFIDYLTKVDVKDLLLTSEENDTFERALKREKEKGKNIYLDNVWEEIIFNTSNMSNDNQVERYITLVLNTFEKHLSRYKKVYNYSVIQSSLHVDYKDGRGKYRILKRDGSTDLSVLGRFAIQILKEVYELEDLQKKIRNISKVKPKIDNEDVNQLFASVVSDYVILTHATHRLYLLHKLGLFDPLVKKHYNNMKIGSFTSLIANMIGIQDKDKINSFRPQLSKFVKEYDSKKPSDDYFKVITPKLKKEVNKYLADIGLNELIE